MSGLKRTHEPPSKPEPEPSLSLRVADMVALCSERAHVLAIAQSKGQAVPPLPNEFYPTTINPRLLDLRERSSSLLVADTVALCSERANLLAIAQSQGQFVPPSPNGLYPGTTVNPRFLELRQRSTFCDDKSRAEVQIMPAPPAKYREERKVDSAPPFAGQPSPSDRFVQEIQIQVPQSRPLDHSRSIVFSRSQNQLPGVSLAELLRPKGSLYRGKDMIDRTGSVPLFLRWPGYKPTMLYVRFERVIWRMDYSGRTTQRISFEDFANALAQQIQLWLCELSRSEYRMDGKEWKLTVECVAPVEEVFVIAVGPMLPPLIIDEQELWGIVLHKTVTRQH